MNRAHFGLKIVRNATPNAPKSGRKSQLGNSTEPTEPSTPVSTEFQPTTAVASRTTKSTPVALIAPPIVMTPVRIGEIGPSSIGG